MQKRGIQNQAVFVALHPTQASPEQGGGDFETVRGQQYPHPRTNWLDIQGE